MGTIEPILSILESKQERTDSEPGDRFFHLISPPVSPAGHILDHALNRQRDATFEIYAAASHTTRNDKYADLVLFPSCGYIVEWPSQHCKYRYVRPIPLCANFTSTELTKLF